MPENDFKGHKLVQGGYKSPVVHAAKAGKFFSIFDPEHPDKPGLLLKQAHKKSEQAKGFVIRGTIGRHGCLEFTTDLVSSWAGTDHAAYGGLSMFLPGKALEVQPMGMLSPDWSCVVEVVGEETSGQ